MNDFLSTLTLHMFVLAFHYGCIITVNTQCVVIDEWCPKNMACDK